ncbi:hypothetical protein D3C77_257840 [compost metagenome]
MHPEAALACTEVVTVFSLLADLAEQAREDGLVQFRVVGRLFVDAQLQVAADQAQLSVGIAPFAQAQIIQEVLAAPVAQGARGQGLALLFKTTPQIDQGGEVRIDILPLRMGLVGSLLALGRTLARILHRQGTGDDQQLVQAALLGAFEQHAAQARVDGQARQLPAQRRQLVLAVDRRELLQQVEAVADSLAIWRLDERERVDLAQAQVQHLQDDCSQVGAQDLGVGEGRAGVEVFLAVQAHADARLHPPAATLALVGAGLGHGLDRQPLDLGAVAVAADACGAAVDYVANARHCQRGLGNVGRQYHATARMGLEDLLLLGRRQARIQRQDFGVAQLGLAQHFGGVANLALTWQEHQHIARPLALAALEGGNFVEGGEDGLVHRQVVFDPVALLVLLAGQRPVPGFHRVGAAGHFNDRRIVEVLGKTLQVDGRRGNDHLEVRATRQQGLQVAEQEVDVQAALVGFVDNDGVVALEKTVVLGFSQQDAVGHQLDQGVGIALVFKAHLIAHQSPQRRAEFFGHPGRHTARRDTPWLGVGNQAMLATAQFQADFR